MGDSGAMNEPIYSNHERRLRKNAQTGEGAQAPCSTLEIP